MHVVANAPYEWELFQEPIPHFNNASSQSPSGSPQLAPECMQRFRCLARSPRRRGGARAPFSLASCVLGLGVLRCSNTRSTVRHRHAVRVTSLDGVVFRRRSFGRRFWKLYQFWIFWQKCMSMMPDTDMERDNE